MSFPEALTSRIREACGNGLLLDARQGRGIIADARAVSDLAQRLKLCGFTRCVDYTLHELPGGTGAPPVAQMIDLHATGDGARATKIVFQFHLTLRAPEYTHSALHLKWKYTLDAHDPQPFPSLSRVWPSAGLAEREIFELYGLPFSGHENLAPLLLDEQFRGSPLRRGYAPPTWPSYAAELLRQRHEAALLAGLRAASPVGAGFIPPSAPDSDGGGMNAAPSDGGAL